MMMNTDQASAHDETQRLLGLMVSIAALALAATQLDGLLTDAKVANSLWELTSALLLLVIAASLMLSYSIPVLALQVLWSAAACLAFSLTWSWDFVTVHDGIWPWTWSISAGAVGFAAIAWPWPVAMLYAVVLPLAPAVGVLQAHGHIGSDVGWQVLAYSGNAAFVPIFVTIRRQLEHIWETERVAAQNRQNRTHQEALRTAQRRANTYVHDELLSLLNALAMREGPVADEVWQQAQHTITTLEHRAIGAPSEIDMFTSVDEVPVGELVAHLTGALETLAPEASLTLHVEEGTLPPLVVVKISGAFREAIKNSVAHAQVEDSHRVEREAQIHVAPNAVRVSLTDDGQGFDLLGLPPTRLGITGSLLGRMDALPGGQGLIRTHPGAGTRVELSWTRL